MVPAVVLAVMVLGSAAPVLAERSPQPTPRNDRGSEKRQEVASRSQEFLIQLRAKKEQERRDRLAKFWKKTGERLQRLIDREKKVADKIGARIDRLATKGRDPAQITKLKDALAAARLKIDAAQTALTDATTQIKQMITDGKPVADIIAKARELHKGVVAKIREAHKALIDVLVSTRGLSVTPSPTPTPTP